MIIHNVIQGTDAWHNLRQGKPTASQFKRILTSKKLELSASAVTYAEELVAEDLTGESADGGSSQFMERGKDMEAEAVRYYEMEKDIETTVVGFVTNDDETVGCSPDRFVGDKGGLDTKCPAAKTQVKYVTKPETLVAEYRLQIQGCLWVCEREWWDLVSFNPCIQSVIVRVERDEACIEALAKAMPKFLALVEQKREHIFSMMR